MNTQTHSKLTRDERRNIANEVIAGMRETYEAEGVEGDFDDGYNYLAYHCSDEELLIEKDKWCNNA